MNMINVIVSVRDNAIGAFSNPVAVRARGEALRSFVDEVNNKDSPMNRHPKDYDLYVLGEFDTVTGRLVPAEFPEPFAKGSDVVSVD